MGAKISHGSSNQVGGGPVSEINVTPLVDVMLVLLIVFMVAAPLMAQGVKVDLPTSNAKPLIEEKPPVAVSLDSQGTLFVDKTEVTHDTLIAVLTRETEGDKERRINIRGDKALAYGKVIEAMGEINDAGFSKIALVSDPPKN
ncbi:MAG: protein TolR [Oxalicibacterium faecigallinarum]|uniref:protein TolR n=1 Tax=Oxalicibacterium faecigallinarum TaxID=573741 RepID=UPI002807121C|nr:protein TolR [Oxalicibacterium faecigallinarum]MDQ7969419.1 protein TolR [Oxalicibacterium faecigallinarum]